MASLKTHKIVLKYMNQIFGFWALQINFVKNTIEDF